MYYQQTTQTPNVVFDTLLTTLTFSELRILMCIIRQTYGWVTKKGKRKERDRINYSQFHTKTGVSLRSIPDAIQSLIIKQLIQVTDYHGNLLHYPHQRKGKTRIYYAPRFIRCAKNNKKVGKKQQEPMQNMAYNKTKGTKLTRQKSISKYKRKSDWERIQEILNKQK